MSANSRKSNSVPGLSGLTWRQTMAALNDLVLLARLLLQRRRLLAHLTVTGPQQTARWEDNLARVAALDRRADEVLAGLERCLPPEFSRPPEFREPHQDPPMAPEIAAALIAAPSPTSGALQTPRAPHAVRSTDVEQG